MGRVYLAHDNLLERAVALKELVAPAYLDDEEKEEVRKRFNLEARAAARLTHPHILTVHDIMASGDRQFIVMEYLEGKTLRQILSERTFSAEELLSIAPMVSEALEYAHSHGIVHRDIKPDNIFVLENGNIKVADFGIAKMLRVSDRTHTDVIMGTPNYIAPELVKGMAYDHRVDIFSLGVTLYELLAGKRPFDAENDFAIIFRVASEEPVPLGEIRDDLNTDLVQVIHRAMEKNPDWRYQDMKVFKEDLMKVRAKLGMSTAITEETFDKETALQSELEMAKDLDYDESTQGEPSGEFDFQRDKEWKELITRIYHKEPDEQDVALSSSTRTRWEDLEAMARGEKELSTTRGAAAVKARATVTRAAKAPPLPRLPATATKEMAVATPAEKARLHDPKRTITWSVVVIVTGLLAILSVMVPWITSRLNPASILYGINFPEGAVTTLFAILVLVADALLLAGVGNPRRWASMMKVFSLCILIVVLLFFGLRIFGGVGYEQSTTLAGMDYLQGVGWGLWLALASSVVTVFSSYQVAKAAI